MVLPFLFKTKGWLQEERRSSDYLSNYKSPVENLLESVIDNVIRDKVKPVIGSVVYCDLAAGQAEHSGVYIGNNRIVHLNGDGVIESVTPDKFMNRLDGLNTAISIYVSCHKGEAVGNVEVAERAKGQIGHRREYSLIFDNCHQLTSGCLSGNFDNSCNFFTFLKDEVRDIIGGDEWCVWSL